jgi:hypothetical protein
VQIVLCLGYMIELDVLDYTATDSQDTLEPCIPTTALLGLCLRSLKATITWDFWLHPPSPIAPSPKS